MLTGSDSAEDCSEPYASGYLTEAEEYYTMQEQVLLYGGFYIGRYEAGVNQTTLRTTSSDAQPVVVKKGVAPYTYVPWGAAMDDAGEVDGKSGAVYLAKNKYEIPTAAQNAVASTLCYGCQWDAMCRYVGGDMKLGAYQSAVGLTGSVSEDVLKNIYDLAGNCQEWSMEAKAPNCRVSRGGRYNGLTSSFRVCTSVLDDGYDFVTFRITLYIK